jgi:histidyl-tRNA synthetase
MISKPPGIEDIFPDKIDKWNNIIDTARDEFALFNFKEIIIPIMEFTEVFARGIGGETDIVSKEMFTFEDRGGRSLTLRPEGTASAVRAYVENGEFNRLSICKFFYWGPMFRAEKPQKGRLRQFNQFGAEIFGSSDPYHDFEIISMVDSIAKKLKIEGYELLLNSIGCTECRPDFLSSLKKYYSEKLPLLCDDCRRRYDKNILRLLDCKNEKCSEIKKEAPVITDFICGKCSDHHVKVKAYISDAKITFREDPLLVRGLDYYSRTTFEFVTTNLGAQNAFAAGGRYDSLVETFEGKPTPAVGFAAGVERLLLMTEKNDIPEIGLDVYVIHSGGKTLSAAIKIAGELRDNFISTDIDPSGAGFKSQFKKADREKAKFCAILGENEFQSGEITVKNMTTGEQVKCSQADLISRINSGLGRKGE